MSITGSTYTVTDAWDDVLGLIKNAPVSEQRKIRAADKVSSRIWIEKPWRDSLKTITAASIPCVDGTQDYSAPTDIYRVTKLRLQRTDVSPNENRELDVCQNLDVELRKQPYTTLRSACYQPATTQLRLEAAIEVPTGTVINIEGEYQPNHTKIVDVGNSLWFRDAQLYDCFIEGLTYWGYKFTDDPRAGSATYNEGDEPTYTGQLAAFMSSLKAAAKSEDFPAEDSVFPRESIAPWRDASYGLSIFNG